MEGCEIIKDFTPISKLGSLDNLNVRETNIFGISFLIKNKNIKELNLHYCNNIKDFNPISALEELESLDISDTNISDIPI